MTDDTMTEDEARQFAEATLLDVVRGDGGDFALSVELRDGRYSVRLIMPGEPPQPATEGGTFAEAWLSVPPLGERRGRFGMIEGGKA